MSDPRDRRFVQESIDTGLSALRGDPRLAQRIMHQERTEKPIMKKKISAGFVLALALVLLAVTALAVALLTPKEVVEQVAVPLAQQNDKDWRVEMDFTPEELAAFIRACNENGIDLDENNAIMAAFRNGEGYNEQEAIMEVCRAAFGGIYPEWTIAERHWYQDMMVQIGWATENHEPLPGPDDLPEEDARALLIAAVRAAFDEDLPLEDKAQFELCLDYYGDTEDGTTWGLACHPCAAGAEQYYEAFLDKEGNVLETSAVDYGRSQTLEDRGYVYTLTEEEAVRLAAEGVRAQTGRDVPLEDAEKYHSFAYRTTDPLGWQVNFVSHTADWGFCSTWVDDATGAVTVASADVGEVTADTILGRYRNQYGWYSGWDTAVWAEIAARAASLPAETLEGRVVKVTPWIDWREGLLTRDAAEEAAFRQAGVRLGDVNCACLIGAEPHPVWKFRLLPWDESYPDSIVVEIDAVTGEMTDLDMYKSDYSDLEPSFHMITLRSIWSRIEYEENGPLYIARLAVLHKFADLSFDVPEVDDLPIFDLRYWQPEVEERVVRFRSRWSDLPDYEVELDENGMAVRVEEKAPSGAEPLPPELDRECLDESWYAIDSRALAEAQQTYGLNDTTWPLEVQAAVFAESERTVPRADEMTREEAVAFARSQLPPEAADDAAGSAVGVLCQRLDAGLPTEKLRWMVTFMPDPESKDGWRVTFLDKSDPDYAFTIVVNEPGDNGNG